MFNIVLFEPEIPPNTGNIARLCVANNCKLFLVQPLGFSLSDKHLKRAGLDYWKYVQVEIVNSLDELIITYNQNNFYYLTTKVSIPYSSKTFLRDDFLVFGPESRGLPNKYVTNKNAITIPMLSNNVRSLNLATAVGIVLYEGIRQLAPVITNTINDN